MGSELPYMRLWVDDMLADLAELGLTDEEFGAYMRLLLVAWKGRPINADVRKNSRYVSASPRRLSELWDAFAHKWDSDGNGALVSRRLEQERDEATAKSEAARKAAKARWDK